MPVNDRAHQKIGACFCYNLPAAMATELFKPSTDVASLLGKFFDLGEGFAWEELAKRWCFHFFTKFDGPWTPIQWAKIFAKTFCGH